MMQTPPGNGQEQGGDIVTGRSSSDANRDINGVETSNSTSKSAELPREGNEDTKSEDIIGDLNDGDSLYGIQNPESPRERPEESEGEGSHDDGSIYTVQTPGGEAQETVTTAIPRNEAHGSSTGATEMLMINTIPPEPAPPVPQKRPPAEPPVSKEALAELDLAAIIYLPKFRYDINFSDIQYGPSPDGEKAKQKQRKADKFWHTLQIEISEYLSDSKAFEAINPGNVWTLPAILKAIGEILAALVPRADRPAIEEALNVDLLMQQFSKGIADLEQLCQWFSQTLRSHCAPIRDDWVFEMVDQLTVGSRNGDIKMTVEGFRMLLGIVEAMRLDVTNHQIRRLKPLLIRNTVDFHQRNFLQKIALRKIDIYASYDWFRSYKEPSLDPIFSLEGGMWVLFKGILDLLRSDRKSALPDTMRFDNERIAVLRNDFLDAVNLEVCMAYFDNLDDILQPVKASPLTTAHEINSLTVPANLNARPESKKHWNQTKSTNGTPPKTCESPGSINAAEQSLEDNPSSVSTSKTFKNNATKVEKTSQSTFLQKPTLLKLNTQYRTKADLQSAILAILDDCSHSSPAYYDRWQRAGPDLALEIMRGASATSDEITLFEKLLTAEFSEPSPGIFRASERAVLKILGQLIQKYVVDWEYLDNESLYEVAVESLRAPLPPRRGEPHCSGMAPPSKSTVPTGNEHLDSMAKRLAHIGILHWRIWSHILYKLDPSQVRPTDYGGEMN